ncbi:MAG TPA: hypothetical protein VNA17_00075 [Pyrinomonadaceae bacterium]|nr:hypothetical protein [Pyrinomonadaceae bacterium]
MKSLLLIMFLVLGIHGQWVKQAVDTTASFRGLSVVNEKIVWASGTGGTVIRTIDGGKTWNVISVPGAEKLDFRDIGAFDANTAYILSIGNGDSSRIYKTTDGGRTWKLQFTNADPKAFFDAIACWDRSNCIAMSDPVDGHYVLISTANGGANWIRIVSNRMPAAKDGEAAFAASGTCMITQGKNTAFLVSGGADARVFRSDDRGKTWTVADAPIIKGTAGSGIFSIAMKDSSNGIIVGGNYEKPGEKLNALAFTSDGGRSWRAAQGLGGYRSAVAYIGKTSVVAVGTNGSDISADLGKTWRPLGSENLNSVAGYSRGYSFYTWAVGPNGMIATYGQSVHISVR